jgi:uncharacterized protein YndB with AHSA1/START domain
MAEPRDLVLERLLDAPRDLAWTAWTAWTTPGHLTKWWAPKPCETPECRFDLRPGGIFHTHMTGPGCFDFSGAGCFLEVVEGQRVIWTSALGRASGPTTSVRLAPAIRLHRGRHAGGSRRSPFTGR